jgi:hypothetical protein
MNSNRCEVPQLNTGGLRGFVFGNGDSRTLTAVAVSIDHRLKGYISRGTPHPCPLVHRWHLEARLPSQGLRERLLVDVPKSLMQPLSSASQQRYPRLR